MKRKLIILIGIFLQIGEICIGQVFNPSFNSRDISHLDITKIERGTNNTTVYFKYKASSEYQNGGFVCAGNTFFIRDSKTKIKYKLIKTNNIPICPEKYNFQYVGQILEFNIVFQAIPSSTKEIDIIEDESIKVFNFYGVKLNSSNDKNIRNANNTNSSSNTNTTNTSSNNNTTSTTNNTSNTISKNQICDNIKYTPISSKPTFDNMLSGVKYAIIINSPNINGHIPAFNALFEYLKVMGFETVEYMNEDYEPASNPCQEIYTYITFKYDLQKFTNIKWHFESPCNESYTWELSSYNIAKAGLYDNAKSNFYNVLREMHPLRKYSFNSNYTVKLPKMQTCWTEASIKSYITTNGCDKVEGIYENSASASLEVKYKVAVRAINGVYHLIYLSGAEHTGNWKEGEIKAILEPTATPSFFKAKWFMADKTDNNDFYISFESGLMNVISPVDGKSLYVKMFPTSSENIRNIPSTQSGSGTGWAISSNGYIVTNYHITNGASSIKVRGINGDFSKSYIAKVIIEDKNNDLSIIKIDDPSFTTLGVIPYVINNRASDVGTSIFVLGYPLRASMGDEVKLTNGIISSKSGFQGDVTSYQFTAPVQPGNSGGPLFDNKGNIIGVINAKHIGAENVSYAIKASYLLNLIDLLPSPPKLQTINTLAGKSLTEQVKILKKFTYIIEINQ